MTELGSVIFQYQWTNRLIIIVTKFNMHLVYKALLTLVLLLHESLAMSSVFSLWLPWPQFTVVFYPPC